MGPNIVSVNGYISELGKGYLKCLIYFAYYTQISKDIRELSLSKYVSTNA